MIVTGAANSNSNTATGTIQGGRGGNGSNAFPPGGAGGSGITFSASGNTLINAGDILGGQGGLAGGGGITAVTGAGGVGVAGGGLTIINSGFIQGGLSGDGTTRANAITFTSGSNRLVIQAGSEINGIVQAFTSSDVLAAGGAATQIFDISAVGPTGQFRGFGALEKVDSGTVILTGATAFTGPTTVLGGKLTVLGSLAGSIVTVQSNATLAGFGTVGGIVATSSSTIGDSNIGTLRVAGNVTFQPGSNLQVAVEPSGGNFRIAATGSATLRGGTVQVLAQNVNYAASTTYTILTAAGGVSGQFAAVTSNLAFLDPSLSYDGNNAFLTLRRNQTDFTSLALTPNQRQVASALLTIGVTNPLVVALLSRSSLQAQLALTQLAGEVNASQVTSSFQMALMLQQAIVSRLTGGFGGPGGGLGLATGSTVEASYAADLPGGRRPERVAVPVGDLDPRVFSVWGSGFGSFGSTAGNGNAGALTRDVGGFVIGADATIDRMWRIGIAGGYTNSNFDVRSVLSRGETETGFGALYGGARFGQVTARLGLLGAGQSTTTRRVVAFPGLTDVLSARFGGIGIVGFGEVGYGIDLAPVAVEPFIGAAAIHLSRDGYTERGGAAALVVSQRDYDIQTVTAGVRASMAIAPDSPFSVRGQLAYRHAFGDVVPRALLAFAAGGTQFQTAGIPVDRDAVVAEAGIGWQVTRDVALELAYTGQVGSRAEDHGVKGSFLWKF